MNSNDLTRANKLLSDLHSLEMAAKSLREGGNVQSLTVLGKVREISASDAARMANPERGTPPSFESMSYPMGGTFTTVTDLEFPQRLLEGIAEHLQHRIQRITSELHEMGIEYGS